VEWSLLSPTVFEILNSKAFGSAQATSYWWYFGTKPLSPTISEIFNGECDAMIDMIKRPLNKSQGHTFWYQLIAHIRHPIGCK